MQSFTDYLHRVVENNSLWIVLIELFLIGLIIYWIVDFLEGTRGERLFRGVLFILVAGVLVLNLIVQRLPFDRLQYLYKFFLVGILIVTVAAFQPEIRRVLIRIGQPRIWAGSSEQLSRTIREVVSAACEFSVTRTGAIIVLERQVALGEFIETAVRIDARVTSELLRTIFYPGTSLHDMAVIIRDDRIVAANVQLPLAEAEAVRQGAEGIHGIPDSTASQLGSRHRAAIGITSGSDAICVVVSEETGAISLARDGRLTRNITEAQLRAQLVETMTRGKVPAITAGLQRIFKKIKGSNT